MTISRNLSILAENVDTSGLLSLTTGVTGTLPTTNGGTGVTSFTSGGAVYATSTFALTTGTLPIASGGTAATTASQALTNLGGTTLGKAIAMTIVFG